MRSFYYIVDVFMKILFFFSAHQRPQSEAGESVMSVISRSARAPTITTAPTTSSNQSQQKRQQKKSSDERVTLFAHLAIYTRNLDDLSITL
jgi:hypothetical protein